jgi:hypothetical protein
VTAADLREQLLALPVGTSFTREAVLELLEQLEASGGDPEVYNVASLALRWHRSPSAVRALCEQGLLPGAWKHEGKAWRIPRAGVLGYEAAMADRCADVCTGAARGGGLGLKALARGPEA